MEVEITATEPIKTSEIKTSEKIMTPEPIHVEEKEGTEKMKKGKDFTPEERDAIIASAQEVGAVKAAEEAGTSPQVIAGWMTSKKRWPKKNTAVVPGQNGMPAKRDDYHDYTAEERKLLVAKADEVGNPAVKNAYSLETYILHDWRKVLMHQANKTEKKQLKPENPVPEETIPTKKTAEPTPQEKTVVIPEVSPQEAPVLPKIPPEQPAPAAKQSSAANYPLEVEVILLREKVAALTEQIEKLRAVVSTLM